MILLVGASASGKTEVAKLLKALYGIKKVITHTTRPIRKSEENDVDYHFVSKDEFLNIMVIFMAHLKKKLPMIRF